MHDASTILFAAGEIFRGIGGPILVSLYIGYDASKRYKSKLKGLVWFFASILLSFIAWIIYFIVRPSKD